MENKHENKKEKTEQYLEEIIDVKRSNFQIVRSGKLKGEGNKRRFTVPDASKLNEIYRKKATSRNFGKGKPIQAVNVLFKNVLTSDEVIPQDELKKMVRRAAVKMVGRKIK